MSAELWTLLGTLVGATSTIGATFAGGRSNRLQTEITVRAEHRRQRIESRELIYRQFVKAVSEMLDHARSVSEFDLREAVEASDDFAARASSLHEKVRERWNEVSLAGPESVAICASNVLKMCMVISCVASAVNQNTRSGNTRTPLYLRNETDIRPLGSEAIQDMECLLRSDFLNFIDYARIALDDYGI